MNEEEYIKNRLDNQIDWYAKKSMSYKRWFYQMKTAEIVVASALPFAFYLKPTKQFTPLLSVLIVILAGLMPLFKFQELWIAYRTTSESLKQEKFLYETKTAPYHQEHRFNLFVQNAEDIISKENTLWKRKIGLKNE